MNKKKLMIFTSLLFFSTALISDLSAKNMTKTNATYKANRNSDNVSDITVKDMTGKKIPLSSYRGKVLLIVNLASNCGYTPQYEGLEKLYKTYQAKGFEILGFPCNDFGGQEPGSNEEIQLFCKKNYDVTFKLFDKVKIIGSDKNPLYERLGNNKITPQEEVGWNFEKYLISKEGKIIKRFQSDVEPLSKELVKAVEKELKAKI